MLYHEHCNSMWRTETLFSPKFSLSSQIFLVWAVSAPNQKQVIWIRKLSVYTDVVTNTRATLAAVLSWKSCATVLLHVPVFCCSHWQRVCSGSTRCNAFQYKSELGISDPQVATGTPPQVGISTQKVGGTCPHPDLEIQDGPSVYQHFIVYYLL